MAIALLAQPRDANKRFLCSLLLTCVLFLNSGLQKTKSNQCISGLENTVKEPDLQIIKELHES